MVEVFHLNTLAKFHGNPGLLSHDDLKKIEQVLSKADFNAVALVSLEAGQEIPPHAEPNGVCFYVINGKGLFTVGSERVELASGDMMFAPANEARGILSRERLTLLGIHGTHE